MELKRKIHFYVHTTRVNIMLIISNFLLPFHFKDSFIKARILYTYSIAFIPPSSN